MIMPLTFKRFLLLLLISFSLNLDIGAVPAQVIIIRHGEKPSSGITLNLKGRERANALVPYLLETPEFSQYGSPAAIYAQKQKTSTNSIRPIETVLPLSSALHLPINTSFERDDYQSMIEQILKEPDYDGRTVIISWGHSVIGDMARAFGAEKAPKKWPDAYDRVWLLTFKEDGSVKFSDIPQKLLYGDSKN